VSRLWPLAWTAVAFAAATLGALTLRRLLLRAVPRWAPESQALGATATALRRPSLWWCVVVGLYVASEIADDFTLLPPILAALGVGGLAVALALQDTLSNLFAGIHLLVDNPLRVGDHVKLGDRAEGFVIAPSGSSSASTRRPILMP
jgi:small-conductance mechanosensitive channel